MVRANPAARAAARLNHLIHRAMRWAPVALLIAVAASAAPMRAASPLEGDWQMYGAGARLRFCERPGAQGILDIVWLDGPDLSIAPGTVVGQAVQAPAPGTFDCSVDMDPRGSADRKRYARFVVRLDPTTADSFTFAPYEQGVKFSIQGLLPYWWRRPLKSVDTRPSNLDGARRVGAPKPYVEL